MGILNDKKDIFGKIAAMRTITEGFPKLNLSDSMGSINNSANSLDFLLDLLKVLIGYEELRDTFVDIVTYELDRIELEVKNVLKDQLKEFVNCSVNPSIPEEILHTNINENSSGLDIKVRDLDYFNIFFVNPTSEFGSLLYDDPNSGLNSTDLNTFLYNTIQNPNTETTWGANSPIGDEILSFNFSPLGNVNNLLNIKVSEFYSNPTNSKKLTDLNNDFIDSIKLFASDKVITNIIDSIFGSLSTTMNKSNQQLEFEEQINNIVDSIMNSEDETVINDSYFEFTNDEAYIHQVNAENRRKGVRKLLTCNEVDSTVEVTSLSTTQTNIENASTLKEVKSVISSDINEMANESATNVDEGDRYSAKLDFINELIKKLTLTIVNVILSPKVLLMLIMNFKIINGFESGFDNPIDFLRKNKTLVTNIINKIRDIIIKILLQKILKAVKELVAKNVAKIASEKALNNQLQLLSLVGVPQEVLQIIRSL